MQAAADIELDAVDLERALAAGVDLTDAFALADFFGFDVRDADYVDFFIL
jgi:hypothetical protein